MKSDLRFPYLLSLAFLCVGAFAQQSAGAGGAQADRFLGKWKLNVEKSSPTPRGETITIKPEGKRYMITQEFIDRDGNRSGDWILTDMKGSDSPLMHTDSTTTDVQWRIHRDGPTSFVVLALYHGPGVVFRSELQYTVSPDGMTLTRRTLSGGPTSQQNRVIVFDRVP